MLCLRDLHQDGAGVGVLLDGLLEAPDPRDEPAELEVERLGQVPEDPPDGTVLQVEDEALEELDDCRVQLRD